MLIFFVSFKDWFEFLASSYLVKLKQNFLFKKKKISVEIWTFFLSARLNILWLRQGKLEVNSIGSAVIQL